VDTNRDGEISREEATILAQEAYIPSNAAVMSLLAELDAVTRSWDSICQYHHTHTLLCVAIVES
jgi:hypothetical protein